MSCTLLGVFQILYTPLSPQKSFVGASKSMINKYIFYTSCNHLKALFFCASTFELLEKLADDQLNSRLFDFRC
jgi:hypothetical protein